MLNIKLILTMRNINISINYLLINIIYYFTLNLINVTCINSNKLVITIYIYIYCISSIDKHLNL